MFERFPRARRRLLRAGLVALGCYALLLLAARLVPLPNGFFDVGSTVVEFADGSVAHVFLSPDQKWRVEVGLSEVDPLFLESLIALEDRRFWHHGGVDPIAVLRAALSNLSQGRIVSGASTITMQLVRVREPRPRALRSKLVEAFRALQLEARFDKEQILERYLQYTPYGRNVEGVEAASLAYFGHRANALSADEIATLLAVPQNPNQRFPHSSHTARLGEARDRIAARLVDARVLPSSEQPAAALAAIKSAAVPQKLLAFPRLAPHAAYWLLANAPGERRIRTTLDRGIQMFAERTVTAAGVELRREGIANAAVVIVDHERGEVRALVGNFGFFAADRGAQIPAFAAARSPGSALKPFIYGLGIDAGRLLPEQLVLDTPVSFGGYSPENYDGHFAGLVRLEDALAQSLNVPFVNALEQIGTERFISSLRLWGVHSLSDEPGHYGLSAAIGAVEITPLEMAGLYAMLAQDGHYRELLIRPSDGRQKRFEIDGLSKGASYLTRRALRIRDRPDFPARRRYTGVAPSIFWKTGTSYGHRDAWTAGSGEQLTAVVWLGNLDHSPSSHLVGAEAAGPIFFDLIEGLERGKKKARFEPVPNELSSVEVCSYSGRRAGPGCPDKKRVLALTRAVPTETCPYHVAVDVELSTGLALAPDCRGGRAYQSQSFLVYPASLRRYLSNEHRRLPSPPSPAEGCSTRVANNGPAILTPAPNQVTLLLPDVDPGVQEVPLLAESSSARVSWFVDGEFLGTVPADERVWWQPRLGRHELVVSDDAGRSARRTLLVRNQL